MGVPLTKVAVPVSIDPEAGLEQMLDGMFQILGEILEELVQAVLVHLMLGGTFLILEEQGGLGHLMSDGMFQIQGQVELDGKHRHQHQNPPHRNPPVGVGVTVVAVGAVGGDGAVAAVGVETAVVGAAVEVVAVVEVVVEEEDVGKVNGLLAYGNNYIIL